MKEFLAKICLDVNKDLFSVIINKTIVEGRFKIDRIEIKTLTYCFRSFNEVLNSDIQAFTDFDHSERFTLLKMTSQLLTIGF